MKNYYLIAFLLFSAFTQAQIVDIPDYAFKNRLVNYNCVDTDSNGIPDVDADTNNDGEIQVSEAEAVIDLILGGWEWEQIYSLEGIESFQNIERLSFTWNSVSNLDISQNKNLTWLDCKFNSLTNLNVSQNLNLIILSCSSNELTSLDVSQNLNLSSLSCSNNQFTNLDLSQNYMLRALSCINNPLTHLDLSQNPELELIRCYDSNSLQSLNIKNGNNSILETMLAYNNPNLTCIQVDDESINHPECNQDQGTGWCKDDWTNYSENCALAIEGFNTFNFNIYPNPTKDIINISSQFPVEKIQIYNIQGVLVKESILTNMSISELPSGVYFITVISNKRNQTKKLIKN